MPIPQTDPGAFAREHREEILSAITRVVDGGWYILGREVAALEIECADQFGLAQTVGVANGTDALALALRALDIGSGQTVATVSHTAVATVAAIEMAGAAPLFVDIDPSTLNIDPAALAEALLHEHIDAVVVVHLYGQPADMPTILKLANRAGIPVIEDCAQAHGARHGERCVGSFGAAAAFSFYPTKNLGALGDGGLVAGDAEVAARVRSLRQYGWTAERVSEMPGVNSRLDELQAAILRVKLRHLEAGNRRRADIAQAYDLGLNATGLTLPARQPGTTPVFHQYVVRHGDREGLKERLLAHGIDTRVHYPVPVHAMPAYRGRCPIGPGGLPATEQVVAEILSLPMYPEMTDGAVSQVIEALGRSL
ncbi:MAG: DegT/DnrJ/EryC1/StrS family aminotransferase [Steroidobacteraceae bacterium]|jgi:dTDP-4-amino-4,6-dideoxygalactose transaminase